MKAKTPRTLRAQVEALEQEVRADYKGSAAVELADRLAAILRETEPEPVPLRHDGNNIVAASA